MPKKEFGNPSYIYKTHAPVSKLHLDVALDVDPLKFALRSATIADGTLTLQATSVEEKRNWCSAINSLLATQNDFLKGWSYFTLANGG